MGYFLFILVNATLFIRPAEIVPDLEALPIYNWLMIATLLISFPVILEQLHWESLRVRPISLCVVGMMLAVVLSHLSHLNLYSTRECATEFSKVVLYYLLMVGLVDSPQRLRTFLVLLVAFIVVVAALALLQYHEVIDLPALTVLQQNDYDEETGEVFQTTRLRSTGIFNDPNDLSMILVLGMAISAWKLFDPSGGVLRPAWLAPIGLFGYALALTQSRGGLLALLVAMTALFQSKYGWRRTVPLLALAAPAVLLVFGGGRQTDFGGALEGGTGTSRLQLWTEGFQLFKGAPLFGIGQNEFSEEVGHVAHNSFVHCYTELGFFGGTIFFAAFFMPIVSLYNMKTAEAASLDPAAQRLRPFLLAAIAGFFAAMLGLSRAYGVPTYLILGLAMAFLRFEAPAVPLQFATVDDRLIRRLATASLLFLAVTYTFTRVFVRWE